MGFSKSSLSFHLVVCFLVVSFSSVVMITPSARARTDFTHHPDKQDKTELSESLLSIPDEHKTENSRIDREADMKVVNKALERKQVREKLETLGYTVEEIQERLSRLSDKQIHKMANRIEYVKAGGHLGLNELSLGVLIILIILSPILAVIWVILMIFGHEIHLHRNGSHSHNHY